LLAEHHEGIETLQKRAAELEKRVAELENRPND